MLKPSQPNVADLNQGEMVVRAPASVLGVRKHWDWLQSKVEAHMYGVIRPSSMHKQ